MHFVRDEKIIIEFETYVCLTTSYARDHFCYDCTVVCSLYGLVINLLLYRRRCSLLLNLV